MNDFNPVKDLTNKLAVVTPVKQEYKLIEKIRKIHNLTLYSYNYDTGDILKVKLVSQVAVNEKGEPVFVHKTNFDPKLLYCQALNLKNARRKFSKMITQ